MKLHYREHGEGFPIIILHGLFGMSDNWMTIGKKIGENYHAILPDQRNHGKSGRSDEWNYQVMADDLKELADKLKLDKFHLVGHSMGGKVAMKFAQEYQDRLSKLIVVDIAPRQYPVHHQYILDALFSIDLSKVESRQDAEDQLSSKLKDWGVRQFLLKNLGRNSNGFFWKFNLQVIHDNIENVGEATDPSKKVDVPTLFINGSKSDYIQKKDHSDIKDIFANSTIVTIKDAGHWVHAEKADEFLTTLEKFLEYDPT